MTAPPDPEEVAAQARTAVERCGAMLRDAPGTARLWSVLGSALAVLGEEAGAGQALRRALALEPAEARPWFTLAVAAHGRGDPRTAADHYQRADVLAPGDARVRRRLLETLAAAATAAQGEQRLAAALALDERILARAPDDGATLCRQAGLLFAIGEIAEAVALTRRAVALDPAAAALHSGLLYLLHYVPEIDRETAFLEHRAWAARHAPAAAPAPRPQRADPERALTVGLVSADFRLHATGFFLLPVLKAWPRPGWRLVAYSGVTRPDPVTDAFRHAVDLWRDAAALDDEALARLVAADGVDVLVDLNGHTSGGRLTLFARRAAPLQVAWLDYVDTTAVPAIGAVLADRIHVPAGEERWWTERVIRLPGDYICYGPPPYAPPVGPPPLAANGHVTFGSFNQAAKVSAPAVAAWAAILAAVPGSRLLFSSWEFAHERAQDRIRRLFAAAGTEPARLAFRPGGPHADFMAEYQRIDVALDSFPYSGGLTTCEALWMGVPVVAFPGDRFAGRHAASHLIHAGLAELVATDRDDYVATAVALARDPARLAAYRASLRDRVAASPLCDAAAHAAGVAGALRELWRGLCAGA